MKPGERIHRLAWVNHSLSFELLVGSVPYPNYMERGMFRVRSEGEGERKAMVIRVTHNKFPLHLSSTPEFLSTYRIDSSKPPVPGLFQSYILQNHVAHFTHST